MEINIRQDIAHLFQCQGLRLVLCEFMSELRKISEIIPNTSTESWSFFIYHFYYRQLLFNRIRRQIFQFKFSKKCLCSCKIKETQLITYPHLQFNSLPTTNHHPRHDYRFRGMSVSTASPKVTLEFPSFSLDFRRFLSTKLAPPMNSFSSVLLSA